MPAGRSDRESQQVEIGESVTFVGAFAARAPVGRLKLWNYWEKILLDVSCWPPNTCRNPNIQKCTHDFGAEHKVKCGMPSFSLAVLALLSFAVLCCQRVEGFVPQRVSIPPSGTRSSSATIHPIMAETSGSSSSSSPQGRTASTATALRRSDNSLLPRPGILIVGFGGGNGVTLAAGVLANQKNISWEGPTGRNTPNYLGCITQLPSKGGSGGYRERYALADANNAAIGGWDIRPTPLGEALYNARILDFDLVRQVREEMDTLRLLPGVWDPDFIGESQHESATHVVGSGESQQSRLERLRKDIREFREAEGVTGHVTVIWSASVERPSEREFQEPAQVTANSCCLACMHAAVQISVGTHTLHMSTCSRLPLGLFTAVNLSYEG